MDRNALERALVIAARDHMWGEHLKARLADGEPWMDVAQSAAYHCQTAALRLPPWRCPPCAAGDWDHEAIELLERLLDAGFSGFEPDPPGALRKAKRRRR